MTDTYSSATGMLAASNPYLAVGTGALGLINTIAGFSGLKKISKQKAPEFTEDPAMAAARNRAEVAAKQGFTTEQRQSFESNVTRRQNTSDQIIADRAGGLGQFVTGVSGANRFVADVQFAAADAEKKLNNQRYADRFAENLQMINNMNINQKIDQRNRALTAYGQAAQSGLSQLASGVNSYFATKDGFAGSQQSVFTPSGFPPID